MNATDEIRNEIMRCKWYKFPMAIQKILPIILNGTEEEVGINGYGNIQCSREAFKNVMN